MLPFLASRRKYWGCSNYGVAVSAELGGVLDIWFVVPSIRGIAETGECYSHVFVQNLLNSADTKNPHMVGVLALQMLRLSINDRLTAHGDLHL